MNFAESPALGQKKSLQELLCCLLEVEPGGFRVMEVKELLNTFNVSLSNPQPI